MKGCYRASRFSQKNKVLLDLNHCPNRSDEFKIIAATLELTVIERTLMHLAFEARASLRIHGAWGPDGAISLIVAQCLRLAFDRRLQFGIAGYQLYLA